MSNPFNLFSNSVSGASSISSFANDVATQSNVLPDGTVLDFDAKDDTWMDVDFPERAAAQELEMVIQYGGVLSEDAVQRVLGSTKKLVNANKMSPVTRQLGNQARKLAAVARKHVENTPEHFQAMGELAKAVRAHNQAQAQDAAAAAKQAAESVATKTAPVLTEWKTKQ